METNLRRIFWEYDCSEAELEALLKNPGSREFVLARILTCLQPKDVWEFTTPTEVEEKLDRIPFPQPGAKRMWEAIIRTWRQCGLIR